MPGFAKSNTGYIALQGDHGQVSFRNIKIRPIAPKRKGRSGPLPVSSSMKSQPSASLRAYVGAAHQAGARTFLSAAPSDGSARLGSWPECVALSELPADRNVRAPVCACFWWACLSSGRAPPASFVRLHPPLRRHAGRRQYLSRPLGALRHDPARPGHRPRPLGHRLRLRVHRHLDHGLHPDPFERHGHSRPGRLPVHAPDRRAEAGGRHQGESRQRLSGALFA